MEIQKINHPVTMQDMQVMALAFAKSQLFGMKTPDQALALMLIAQAEGLHPALAARDYHVIQGRPALKADAMLARFQAAGGTVKWDSYTDEKVAGTFNHPQGGTVSITWTLENARQAGLTGKDVWKAYPRAMLRSRVISEAIRTIYPGVAVGVYTDEEVESFTKTTVEVQSTAEPAPKPVAPKVEKAVAAPTEPEVIAATVEEQLEDSAGIRKFLFAQLKLVQEQSGIPKEHLIATAQDMFEKSSAASLTNEELRQLIDVFKPAKESSDA
jgi:hypothetical protein